MRRSSGFFVRENEKRPIPETWGIMITIGKFDNGFKMIVDTFSDSVGDSGGILRSGESGSDTKFPFIISFTNRNQKRMIGRDQSIGDIGNKVQGIIIVSFFTVVKKVLQNIVGREKISVQLDAGEDQVGKMKGGDNTLR